MGSDTQRKVGLGLGLGLGPGNWMDEDSDQNAEWSRRKLGASTGEDTGLNMDPWRCLLGR